MYLLPSMRGGLKIIKCESLTKRDFHRYLVTTEGVFLLFDYEVAADYMNG